MGPVLALPDFVPVLERLIFPNKSPYMDLSPCAGEIPLWVKNLYRNFFDGADLCSIFLWPALKGTVSPYWVENASPWGGILYV